MFRCAWLKSAGDFVQIWDKISELRSTCGATNDVLLNPLHFLAATDTVRRSCSLACWDGQRLAGIVYATAHYVRGRSTGYAVGGDYSGRGLLLCEPRDELAVMEAAIDAFFAAGSAVHSLHLRFLPRGDEKPATRSLSVKYLDAMVPGDRLILGGSYDSFLSTLGKHTRRNVRNFSRKVAEAGIEFVPEVSEAEYAAGVVRLNAETDFPAEAQRLARDERLLALHGGGQRMGLRDAQGVLVAVLAGFSKRGRYHLLTQLNEVKHQKLSLSLVLRGLTVQHLIQTGHDELQFMGGTSLSFGRFCVPENYRSILIDRERGLSRVAKAICCRLVTFLARRGRSVPEILEMICGGFLEEKRLRARTILNPAAVAFQRVSKDRPIDALPTSQNLSAIEH